MTDTKKDIEEFTKLVKNTGEDNDLVKYHIIVGDELFEVYTTEYSIGKGWDVNINGRLSRAANLFDARETAYFASKFYKERD